MELFKKWPEIQNKVSRYGGIIFSLIFLAITFYLLPSYGLNCDSHKNFGEGRINLRYLMTGDSLYYLEQANLAYQIHGAFFFMLGEILKNLFCDTWHWLDPVTSRHLFLPPLVLFFLNTAYAFFKKRCGFLTALGTCAILLTYPHFWGHSFNNIKDVPLFIFMSLSLFYFYDWFDSGFQKKRFFYLFCVSVGFALLNKLYALLAPLIAFLWLLTLPFFPIRPVSVDSTKNQPPLSLFFRTLFKMSPHLIAGIAIIFFLMAAFFMPAFYAVTDKMGFLAAKSNVVKNDIYAQYTHWNLTPWIQVLFVTPVLTLIAAVLGLLKTFFTRTPTAFTSLMLVWFFTVMLIFCTPLLVTYQGIRLFMLFLIPFSYFATQGIDLISEKLSVLAKLKKNTLVWILSAIVLSVQMVGDITTHPYQTTYYNGLAGGLRGALEKGLVDTPDGGYNSYREAVKVINEKMPLHATLFIAQKVGLPLLAYYHLRSDIQTDYVQSLPLPHETFLLLVHSTHPGTTLHGIPAQKIEESAQKMMLLYRVKRQGGNILSIYYNP